MKKITATLTLLFTINFCFAQFPETFDTEIPDSWATFIGENGEGVVQNWRHDANGYAISLFEIVFEESEDWLVTPSVAITEENRILTFNFADLDDDNFGSVLEIRISKGSSQTNHSDFEKVLSFSERLEPGFSLFAASVDLSAYVGENIYVAFVHVQQSGDTFIIDDVNFIDASAVPKAVNSPKPADEEKDITLITEDLDEDGEIDNAVVLSWTVDETGGAPQFYEIYLATEEEATNDNGEIAVPLLQLIPADNPLLVVSGLEYNTKYFWSAVAINFAGNSFDEAEVWSFTTESNPLSATSFKKQVFAHFYNSTSQELNLFTQTNPFQKIIIYDYSGRQVYQQNLKNTEEQVSLSSLAAGGYIAKIAMNNQLQSFKFVKK